MGIKPLLGFLLLLFALPANAANAVFLAPAAAGANNGTSCANAKAGVAYFNNGGNWSATPTGIQIGPATTVHACSGTWSWTDKTNPMLIFQGSGAVGQPVTLFFESGADFTSPAWGSQGNGAITTTGNSHLVIDGNNHLGIIEATANGGGLANQWNSTAIWVPGGTDIVIKNLTIRNICKHLQNVNNSGCFQFGSDDTTIFLANNLSNVTVSGNIISDTNLAIEESAGTNNTGIVITGNTITHTNWGVLVSAASNGTRTTGTIVSFNDISDAVIWDSPNNDYHHNGVISFPGGTGVIDGLVVNSNYIHGDTGQNTTSHVFLDSGGAVPANSIINAKVINNVLVAGAGTHSPGNSFITGANTGAIIANNTIYGANISGGQGCIGGNNFTSNAIVKNNLCSSTWYGIFLGSGVASIGVSDFNVFYLPNQGWVSVANTYATLGAWQAASGYDTHSTVANPNLSGTFTLNAGSSAICAGTNLTSLAIAALNVDKNGTARPAGGCWDIGAFVSGGSGVTPKPAVPPVWF